jgi:hypothetical protein
MLEPFYHSIINSPSILAEPGSSFSGPFNLFLIVAIFAGSDNYARALKYASSHYVPIAIHAP